MNMYRNTYEGDVPEPTTLQPYDTGTAIYTDFSSSPPVDAWQKCPVCEGEGEVPNNDGTAIYDECTVCRGHKIISTITGKPPE